MNILDLVLLVLAVLAAVGGYRLGFVTRTVSWAGMAAGLLVAARSLPWLVGQFERLSAATLLLLAGMVLLAGAFVGQAIGVLLGSRVRFRLPSEDWVVADRAFGGVAGLLGVVASFWLLLPAMAEVPGLFAQQARNSVVARGIDRTLPPAPDTLVALRRLVGDDQFPRVFAALTPAPDLGPPPTDSGLPAEVVARVTPSTVKVTGVACRRFQEGSGFVVLGADVVVTNAHVVAGQDDPQVERDDGALLDATVVAFDADRDLAVLRVPGLARAPLAIGDSASGSAGGVFGRPGGAPLRVAPFVVGEEVRAVGTDIYDARRTERQVLILSAGLRPGDSGAALVDAAGAIVGVAYALDTDELNAVLSGDLATPVATGPCLR